MERELTLFDKIASGEIRAKIIWQNQDFMAFLTPFANMPGASVLIPKKFKGGNFIDMDGDDFTSLMTAAQHVAKILSRAFDVDRVGLVIEGQAVNYVHVKFYPMSIDDSTPDIQSKPVFFEKYPGYLTTKEGPGADPQWLDEIYSKIIKSRDSYMSQDS